MDATRVSDLLYLSLEERLQLVQDLWDSIGLEAVSHPESLPLSAKRREEIRRRSDAHRSDPDAASPLNEALDPPSQANQVGSTT
ncbi:MAG: addiction module protein [Gemmatimonas sp.]|nr:addiction module protein [Gemmatimonas sp.]